jgi:pimeloyl-ACP methyl ester carboxylesterase
MFQKMIIFIATSFFSAVGIAQTETIFTFSDPSLTKGLPIKIQAFEYIPSKPNGKVIIFSHGAVADTSDQRSVKAPIKFMNISKYALDNGYIFVAFMRKGRGASEGEFTEQTRVGCSYGRNDAEQKEALAQLDQVVDQAMAKYGVQKVIVMGHSRGGLLSARYALEKPEKVQAVVVLAGVWNASCEQKTGRSSYQILDDSAKKFKPQLWAYFEYDSYFGNGQADDYEYRDLKKIAAKDGVTFKVFGPGTRKDGHDTPTWQPKDWATDFFPLLNIISK